MNSRWIELDKYAADRKIPPAEIGLIAQTWIKGVHYLLLDGRVYVNFAAADMLAAADAETANEVGETTLKELLARSVLSYTPDAGWLETPNGSLFYIYAMSAGSFLKVGYAKRPAERLVELQCGCPYKMELRFAFRSLSKFGITYTEARVHDHLRPHHFRGEWFHIAALEVFEDFLSVAKSLAKSREGN